MRTYDFAPLWRSSVGFDRLFDLINDTQRLDDPKLKESLLKLAQKWRELVREAVAHKSPRAKVWKRRSFVLNRISFFPPRPVVLSLDT